MPGNRRDVAPLSKKITLTGAKGGGINGLSGSGSLKSVIFDIQPENISESGQAIYQEIADIRQPASILIYTGSPSRSFSLNATFLARTTEEANATFKYIHQIKSWRSPKHPTGANPPEILFLTGLGNNFKRIPVVLTNYNIDMSSDSDLIDFGDGIILPVVTKVSIQLKEAQGNADIKAFNRDKFAAGTMENW